MNNEQSPTKGTIGDTKYMLSAILYGFFIVQVIIMMLSWIVPAPSEIYEHLEGMSYFYPPYRIPLVFSWIVAAALLHLYLNYHHRKSVGEEKLIEPNPTQDRGMQDSSEETGKKRLVAMINTKGKTPQQVGREGWRAFRKYERVKAQVESKDDGKR